MNKKAAQEAQYDSSLLSKMLMIARNENWNPQSVHTQGNKNMIKVISSPVLYSHLFCNLTDYQVKAKLGPRYVYLIPVAIVLISDSPTEKERSCLAAVFWH